MTKDLGGFGELQCAIRFAGNLPGEFVAVVVGPHPHSKADLLEVGDAIDPWRSATRPRRKHRPKAARPTNNTAASATASGKPNPLVRQARRFVFMTLQGMTSRIEPTPRLSKADWNCACKSFARNCWALPSPNPMLPALV